MAITKVTRNMLTTGIVDNSNATAITIDSSERVGVGTTSPLDALHISSAVSSDYRGNLLLDDSTTGFAAGVGGQITFSAEYRSNGEHTEWAAIQGAKANSTDANYAGTLEFKTRANGGALQTNMVLDDSGNVGIGTTSPTGNGNLNVQAHSSSTVTSLKLSTSTSGSGANDGFDLISNANIAYIWNRENERIIFGTNNTEVMRITATGNVGIGTTSPSRVLHTQGSSVLFGNTSGAHEILFGDSAHRYFKLYTPSSPDYASIRTGTTDLLSVHYTGYVDIGAISTTGATAGFRFNPAAGGPGGGTQQSGTTTGFKYAHRFYNPNGQVGYIMTQNSATSYVTSSDYRLKENVVTDWDGTTLLKQLKPSKFNFIADADTTVQGFLAHEVSSIVPEAISGEKDAVYTAEDETNGLGTEGQPNYQGIDQSKLVPLLVKTIQELEARITTLEG